MKQPVGATEETIAILIAQLQKHEEQIYELKIENAALHTLVTRLAELLAVPSPKFEKLSKQCHIIARRLIPAPKPNAMEDLIRGALHHLAEHDRIRKQKPN